MTFVSGGYTGGYVEGYGSSVIETSTATDTIFVFQPGLGNAGYYGGYHSGYRPSTHVLPETGYATDTLVAVGTNPVFFETGRASDTLQLPGYSGGYIAAGYLEPSLTQVLLFETGSASDTLLTGNVYLFETGRAVDSAIVGVALFESATSSDAAFGYSTVVDFTKTLPELATASETMRIGGAAQPYPHGKGLTVVVLSGVGGVRTVISGGALAVVSKSSQSSAALYGDRGKSAAVVQ